MELTPEQLEAVQKGIPYRFRAAGLESEFVLIRADVFERFKGLLAGDELDPEAM